VPGGWEGNRRSGVALAMHHRLIHQYAQWPLSGRWSPILSPSGYSLLSVYTFLPVSGASYTDLRVGGEYLKAGLPLARDGVSTAG